MLSLNFHARIKKEGSALRRLILPAAHLSCRGYGSDYCLRNDFKAEINVFICSGLKDFLYLYLLTDQISAALAVWRSSERVSSQRLLIVGG